ncbi:unnamed protein product [Prunus brigantina]
MAKRLCRHIGQVVEEILVRQLCTKHRYMQISKGNWERGNWPTTCAIKSGRWLGKSRQLYTKHNYLQTSEGSWGWGKMANHLCRHIGQVVQEILDRQLYIKHRYMQTSEGNWRTGK